MGWLVLFLRRRARWFGQVGGVDVLQQQFEVVSQLIKGDANSVVSIAFIRPSEESHERGDQSREALLSNGTRYTIKLRRSEPVTGQPSSRSQHVEEAQRVQDHARSAVSAAERARGVAASSRPGGELLAGGARPAPHAHQSMPALGGGAHAGVGMDARRAVSEALARQKVAYGARGGMPGWSGGIPHRQAPEGPAPVSAAERAEMANEAARREAKQRQRSRALHAKSDTESEPDAHRRRCASRPSTPCTLNSFTLKPGPSTLNPQPCYN